MSVFTAANYMSNSGRTEAEMKAAFEDNLAATKELLGGSAGTQLSIVSDQITPTGAFHTVETQGGAATDNLAQILQTNHPDGRFLMISIATNGHTVVVKHGAGGAGQIILSSGADFSMTHTSMSLLLRRVGTSWEERNRYFGNQGAAHMTYYAGAGVGQTLYSGRQEWKRGANITAASTLPLGVDGNYFSVLGTTTINGLSTAQAGTWVRLLFQGGCLLVSSATLILSYGNHLTRSGDVLDFVSEGGGIWREASPIGVPRVLDATFSSALVQNTTVETQVYAKGVEGNVLGINRRLRLTIKGYWQFNQVLNSGGALVYGTQFRLGFGATIIASAFLSGGIWDGANAYVHGLTSGSLIEIEATISAYGATNVQVGHLAVRATHSTNTTSGGGGGASAVSAFGVPLGVQIIDVNGLTTHARGAATEDSTTPKTVALFVKHNFAHTENFYANDHQVLEVLP